MKWNVILRDYETGKFKAYNIFEHEAFRLAMEKLFERQYPKDRFLKELDQEHLSLRAMYARWQTAQGTAEADCPEPRGAGRHAYWQAERNIGEIRGMHERDAQHHRARRFLLRLQTRSATDGWILPSAIGWGRIINYGKIVFIVRNRTKNSVFWTLKTDFPFLALIQGQTIIPLWPPKTARVAVLALSRASVHLCKVCAETGVWSPVSEFSYGVVRLPSETICASKTQGVPTLSEPCRRYFGGDR